MTLKEKISKVFQLVYLSLEQFRIEIACVQPDFLMGKGEKSVCESGNNTVFALSFELHGFMYSNVIGYCSEA
jgi:hypothetical protein